MTQKKKQNLQGRQQDKPAKPAEPVHAPITEKKQSAPKASISPVAKLNSWLKAHMIWVFCILVLSWVGIRISYYNSIVKSPLYNLYLFSESDNKFFYDWARDLNSDWLNVKPMHPYHHWHKTFADYYLEKHPEKLTEILATAAVKDSSFIPGKMLWNQWYRGNQYHQEPMYAYSLAMFSAMHMDPVKTMLLLQLFLGVLSGVLLFLITRKYFGETVAVVTGILYLFCGSLMYNEIILLRTSWIVFLTILNVFVIDRAFTSQKPRDYFIAGLCIGLSFLMQSTFTLYLVGVLAIMLLFKRLSRSQYLKNAGFLVLGFLIMFSPVIIRNKMVGAPTFSVSSVGIADIIACNVYGTNSISGWSPSAEKETEILAANYKSMPGAVLTTLKTHPSIFSYIGLELQKLKAAWSGIEYPNNENFYFYKQFMPVLHFAFIDFFWLAPLGLAGLLFCIYYGRKHYVLYLAVLIQVMTIMIIFVLARFRAPLVILFIPFAAFAIVECIDLMNRKAAISAAKIGVVALLLYLSFNGYSTEAMDGTIRDGNYSIVYHTYFQNKLDKYKEDKQWGKWLDFQNGIFDLEPDYVRDITPGATLDNVNHVDILRFFTFMHMERSKAYESAGDKANAAKELDKFREFDLITLNSSKNLHIVNSYSADPENYIVLGQIYKEKKQYDSALFYFKKSVATNPKNNDVKKDIGNLYLDLQMYDSAKAYFENILAVNQNDADGINGLGCIYFNRKQYTEAIEQYRKSVLLDPENAQACSNLGRTYFLVGQYQEAVNVFNKERKIAPNNNNDINFIALSYQKMGKADSARKYETLAQKNDPGFKL